MGVESFYADRHKKANSRFTHIQLRTRLEK